MKKKLIAFVTVLGLAFSTPASAQYWGGWSPYGGSVGFYGGLGIAGALVGGLAAGAIIANSNRGYYNNGYNYYGYYGAPRYYAPAPNYYYYGW